MSGLTYTTTCPLCPKTFHHGKVEEMLINGVLNSEGGNLLQSFSKHLFEKHPQEWAQQIMVLPGLMSTMLLLKAFAATSQDESIGAIVEWTRHTLHGFSSFHTSDDKLQAQIVTLGLQPEDCRKVFDVVKIMRDCLEELPPFEPRKPGVYQPTAAELAQANGAPKPS